LPNQLLTDQHRRQLAFRYPDVTIRIPGVPGQRPGYARN